LGVISIIEIITMGEALIDFVPQQRGCSLEEVRDFHKAAGGAPANVAVGLARLGAQVAFMGKVGDDAFGRFLKNTLEENGVDTGNLVFSSEAMTTLAFVSLQEDGERDFAFYRKPGADLLFKINEVKEAYLKTAKIFHFGSLSLTAEPVYSTTLELVKRVRENGLLLSFDPNIRLPLWDSEKKAIDRITELIPVVDVIKVSEEELFLLSGKDDLREGSREIYRMGPGIVVVTLGKDGCYYYTGSNEGHLRGVSVKSIDTTGAGDGFVAAFLAKVLQNGLENLIKDPSLMEESLSFANRIGAFVTTIKGGIPALARIDEMLKK